MMSVKRWRSMAWGMAIAGLLLTGVTRGQEAPRYEISPWGVASGAEWSGDYPRFNPMLAEAGVTWLRYFPEWHSIQPAPDTWNWQRADRLVANARENNLRVLGVFAYLAKFASADGGTRQFPIKDIAFYRNYVTAAMERYKGDITHWEVWNEFNGSFAPGGTPEIYAELTREAYLAAKKIDPNIKIGMSVANFDVNFLDRAIKAGAADRFDFICVHPYENMAAVMDGGEMGFLSLSSNLRKMLKANNQPADIPLWITEIGYQAPIQAEPHADARQAEALLKAYLLSIAQGFDKVFWFEARGPAYGHGTDHGIIREDWSVRPSYVAFKTMTTLLGDAPVYAGWLNLGDGGYGFVYEGAEGPVLAAWAPPETGVQASFETEVAVTDAAGQKRLLPVGQALPLQTSPVFITGMGDSLVAQARANHDQPFPWGGDYSKAKVVTCRLGVTNISNGLTQIKPETTEAVNDLASSWRRPIFDDPKLNNEGRYIYFRVDPQFVPFGTKELEITVVAKRIKGRTAGMTLSYESDRGYRNVSNGYWTIPAGDDWQEHTWKITDANFVGQWGWNFRLDAAGSPDEFFIREVRVSKPR